MKTFEGKLHLWCVVIVIIATLLLAVGRVAAETDPIPNVYLNFSKTSYDLDSSENIKAYITFANLGSDIFTNKGFSDLDYRLFFFIRGPDGKMISFSGLAGVSPTPSLPPGRVAVEKLDNGWARYMEITDLGDLFALSQPGTYTAWVSMPFISHNPINVNLDDNSVSGEAEPLWPTQGSSKSNIESEKISFVLTSASAAGTYDIRVRCRQFIFGEGSRPGVTKYPLGGISVRLYKSSYIEAQGIRPINFKTCNDIVQLPDFKCAKEVKNSPGEYLFSNVEIDDYVVIGYGTGATDYKHLWASISADDTDWDNGGILVDLILMTDIRDKKKPAKTQKVKGSELLIVEPDYVEWSSNKEFYPFAFESDGDWEVEVAIQPPEGFVSDYGSLSQIVSSESKAIQFTVTDVGSKWVSTEVEYNITHKNKKQKIKSEIDVKLSPKLAKEKKKNIYGEDDQGKDKKKKK